ncbi:chloride channel protein, partial [Burkholderia sp. Tr-20390]|nr:chloride channel protein [Burkholderia sp. Tr-20390]
DPLDTLRDEGGKGDEAAPATVPAEGAAHAPAPHDDEPAAAGTHDPARHGPRDAQ